MKKNRVKKKKKKNTQIQDDRFYRTVFSEPLKIKIFHFFFLIHSRLRDLYARGLRRGDLLYLRKLNWIEERKLLLLASNEILKA